MIFHAVHDIRDINAALPLPQKRLQTRVTIFRADSGIQLLVYNEVVGMGQNTIFRGQHIYTARKCFDIHRGTLRRG